MDYVILGSITIDANNIAIKKLSMQKTLRGIGDISKSRVIQLAKANNNCAK